MKSALLFCVVVLLVSSAICPMVCVASLCLNEVMPAPSSDWDGDLESDSKRDEWVEITNNGVASKDASSCYLLNGSSRTVVYGFSGTIAVGEFRAVYGSDAVTWEADNGHSAIGLSLNNSGDTVWLVEVVSGDTLVLDSMAYSSGDVGYDVSLGRSPDASGTWAEFDHLNAMDGTGLDPTPGASNFSDPAPHIVEISRDPLFPTSSDSARILVKAGDASGISQVLLAYDINLEDGEEPGMTRVSGTEDLGTWSYTILPCAPGDTVHYRVSLYDFQSATISPWMGYRVRSSGLQVQINEILADPPADLPGDANGDGERDAADDEFVEIVNCGTVAVDMSGWYLSDQVSVRHVFPDTDMVVAAGEFVTVFGGGVPTGFDGKVFTASGGGLGLSNSGDIVYLYDSEGVLVDIHSYGTEGGRDQAMMRFPDCSDTWMLASDAGLETAFTPHRPNGASSMTSTAVWGDIKALFR